MRIRTNACLMATATMGFALLLAPLASPVMAEDWLQFHENPLLTGATNNTAPGPANPVLLWKFTSPGNMAFNSSPAIHDGRVFVGCDDNNLYCFDEFTGVVLWTFPTNGPVYSSPAVAGGNVYFGSMDGNLYCVDEITGLAALFGSVALCGPVWGSPTIVGNDLYIEAQSAVPAAGGQLYCIDRITALVNWTRTFSGAGMTPLANSYVAVDQSIGMTFAGCHDNIPPFPLGDPTMEANWAAGGLNAWQYYDPNGGFVNCNGAAVDPNFLNQMGGVGQLVFGQHSFGMSNGVVALDEATGLMVWTALPNTDSTSTPAIHDGQVFIGADDQNVYALDELTGAINWATPTGGQVWSAPAVAGGMVFVGSQDHFLYCLDELTGAVNWTYFTGSPCRIEASPAVADRIVFIGDSFGSFFAITTRTGPGPEYKYYQPPEPASPGDVFWGWDELSWHDGPQIVADDWPCNNDDPIVSIRWWGSYIDWADPADPPQIPIGFHIAFWTDVPADPPDEPFSHPGQVVYQFQCVPTWVFVGWDYDPRTNTYEATFEYECQLPEPFEQDPGQNIYWVSIAAKYAGGDEPEYPWGWKTRPHVFQDDAVRIFDPTDPTVWPFYVDGEPIYWPSILESWDMAFELIADSAVKYVQPPDFTSQDPPEINGWDEVSVYELGPQIVADDWPCDDTRPVSDIHWWGSFYDWDMTTPPQVLPNSFHLGIWTDKPANPPDEPFSHPDELLWEYWASQTEYTLEWVGTDVSPRPPDPQDACYYFTVNLPTDDWFWQEPDQAIYWLSVSAFYQAGTTVDYPFGWKTRPHMFQDDAVRIFDPLNPTPGITYIDGEPIEYPDGVTWDTAFKLTTPEVEYVKYSQRPEPYHPQDHFYGWDEYSVYGEDVDPIQIVADDWPCNSDDPVSDVHFWGSFLGWDEPDLPPIMPDSFHLGIWTDMPSPPEPFSHPDRMIWEYVAYNYSADFVGWDLDPRISEPIPRTEACFKFDVDLPVKDWFWQDPGQNIYWLSVAAVYPVGTVPDYPWGWKTRPWMFQDDAVRIFNPTSPTVGSVYILGEPIFWPDPENSWDVAFALTTLPCVCGDINHSGGPVDLVDFATFALCFGLPGPVPPGCPADSFRCSDMDADNDVDLVDFATFALTFGLVSTNTIPNCP